MRLVHIDFQNIPYLTAIQSRASIDSVSSDSEKAPVFSQAISEAFEPYLSVWVEAQDK